MAEIPILGSTNYLPSRDIGAQSSNVNSVKKASTNDAALFSALDDIDRSLNTSQANGQSSDTGPLSLDEAWSRINDLIGAEVENGKLTGDQAADLQDLFGDAFKRGPDDLASSDVQFEDTAFSANSDASTALQDFLKLAADEQGSRSGYNSAGSRGHISLPASWLFDYTA